jgi:trans-aconitate methyltransferase
MAKDDWNPALYQEKHSFVFEYGRELLDLLAPKPGERILDVGCGTGQLTYLIADSGARVVGLDKSPQMIEAARENYPHLEFVVADASDFRFAESFDAVFSNAALHWVTQAEAAAQCIAGRLKEGGRLVAEFGGKDNGGRITRAIQQTVKERFQIEVNHPWYFPTIGEYTTLLESVGLEVRAAWLFERPTPLEGKDGLRNWMRMFCESMLFSIPEEARDEVLKNVEEQVMTTNLKDGVWFVDYRRLRILAYKASRDDAGRD